MSRSTNMNIFVLRQVNNTNKTCSDRSVIGDIEHGYHIIIYEICLDYSVIGIKIDKNVFVLICQPKCANLFL